MPHRRNAKIITVHLTFSIPNLVPAFSSHSMRVCLQKQKKEEFFRPLRGWSRNPGSCVDRDRKRKLTRTFFGPIYDSSVELPIAH